MQYMNNSLIGFIGSQTKRLYYPFIIIVGQRRSGKSMTAQAIAYSLMKKGIVNFNVQTNIIQDIRELIKILLEGKTNQIFIVDEAQDKLNSKEFWSDFSIAMEKIVATQGYLKNIFVVIIPLGIQLNKSLRRLADIKIEMIQKRICKWTIIKKRYGELGFTPKKAVWEFNIPSQLMIPKLDKEMIEAYKQIEQREKKNILQELDDKLSPKDDNKFQDKLEKELEKQIIKVEEEKSDELKELEKQLRMRILKERLERIEAKKKLDETKKRLEEEKNSNIFIDKKTGTLVKIDTTRSETDTDTSFGTKKG